MRFLFLHFFLIATCPFTSLAQCWMRATMTLEPTYLPAQFVIGDNAYFPCGWKNGPPSTSTYVYNSTSDQWSKTTDFGGEKRLDAHGFAIGNKGYVALGELTNYKKYSELWEFDPTTAVWTKKNNVPFYFRGWPFTFSINGHGYLGAGYNSDHPETGNEFWRYNPSADNWTQLADVPGNGRLGAMNLVINGKAYVGLGELNKNPWTAQTDFYVYDPATDTWDTLNSPPFSGAGVATFTIKNKAYGWYKGVGFWEYDPATDSWAQLMDCVPHDGKFMNGFSIYDKGYFAFGQGYNWSLPNQLFEYSPPGLTGISEPAKPVALIYPNPVNERLQFSDNHYENNTAEIFDRSGKLALRSVVSNNTIHTSNLQPGLYMMILRTDTGPVTCRFIKE